jgi:hypothetical protein
MTDFTVSITDTAKLFAIEAATAAHNSRQPAEATPLTDADYVQYVMDKAAESWAQNYPMPVKATYEAAIAAIAVAKLTATTDDAAKLERIGADLVAVKDGKLDEVAASAVAVDA